jgi:methyl-accepting chemotaxis protein
MSTKPPLLERTDANRTNSFDDTIEVEKPKAEVTQHMSNLLGALEGMIQSNVKTAKDSVALSRELIVLQDRATKYEGKLDSHIRTFELNAKAMDDIQGEMGDDLEDIKDKLRRVMSSIKDLGDTLCKGFQALSLQMDSIASDLKAKGKKH